MTLRTVLFRLRLAKEILIYSGERNSLMVLFHWIQIQTSLSLRKKEHGSMTQKEKKTSLKGSKQTLRGRMNRMEQALSSNPDENKEARSFTKVSMLKWH